jgi:hypothetical protein
MKGMAADMEQETFEQTAKRVAGAGRISDGIGTLREKTLHTVLKYYIEPDAVWHEVKVGPYVADIMGSDGIIEIQTRNFSNMRKKLAFLLEQYHVTVVYPAVRLKWLSWIDPVTGEVTKKHKSPKTGTPSAVFAELARIRPLLRSKNLSLKVVLLDMEETRFLNGWSTDKKRGSRRCDRIPVELCSEIAVDKPDDYHRLIPPLLPPVFTTKDYQKQGAVSLSAAQTAVNILVYVGAVRQVGKQGRLNTYEKSYDNTEE